jgi:hypothetical protein
MPSATPVPPGPSHLALFGAEDLLRPDGCPVCRYVAEAGGRFLGWFALEAHAEPTMITRLCQSLGFCPAHSRGLLAQPGAEGRMTAVYTYLLRAAAGYLADGTSPPAPCLACARDAEAAQRALDTLLDGLREQDLRDRYGDAHGLCLPHLRAAMPRGGRRLAAWLAADTLARLAASPPGLAVLAGDRDADTDVRIRLRAALPALSLASRQGDVCEACLTACCMERDALAAWAAAGGGPTGAGSSAGLCPAHLGDACTGPAAARLLALEARRGVAWLAGLTAPGPGRAFRKLAGRRQGSGCGEGQGDCAACRAASTAADRMPQAPHAASASTQLPGLCLRHVMSLRRNDPHRADAFAAVAARRTESVLAELEEAFRKRAWAHRHEPRGPEMSAWRRAAALVDGRVYGGGPPCPLR